MYWTRWTTLYNHIMCGQRFQCQISYFARRAWSPCCPRRGTSSSRSTPSSSATWSPTWPSRTRRSSSWPCIPPSTLIGISDDDDQWDLLLPLKIHCLCWCWHTTSLFIHSVARFWSWGFGEIPRLVGRYCSYLMPNEAGELLQSSSSKPCDRVNEKRFIIRCHSSGYMFGGLLVEYCAPLRCTGWPIRSVTIFYWHWFRSSARFAAAQAE